jgi:cytosine/adenosine deaminase-related metal-dependent hydrolase
MTWAAAARILKAAWIVPVKGEARENSVVLIEKDKILAIAPWDPGQQGDLRQDQKFQDYGNAIIVPGFINLHTHLEYSLLSSFQTDQGLLPWTRALIQAVSGWQPDDWLASARQGVKQAAMHGTSFLVDSSYSGNAATAIAESGLRGLVGLELFGIDEDKANELWLAWLNKFQSLVHSSNATLKSALSSGRLSITVAPHAPYTVCPALWKQANAWALANNQLLLAHLGESQQENRWFLDKDCELLEHLRFAFARGRQDFHFAEGTFSWKRSGLSPVGHLEQHGLLNSNLLAAHAAVINDDDINKLAGHQVAIAHCPRSNARLRNGYAPLEKMRKAALKIGLGTDSLASCDDLDLLNEARFAIALNRALNPGSSFASRQALASITIDAARCLDQSHQIGSLESAKKADLAIFQIENPIAGSQAPLRADPYELLIHGKVRLLELIVDGSTVYRCSEPAIN